MAGYTSGFKIALWNARSVKNKIVELKEKVEEYDIMGITETWLTKKNGFKIKEYNTFRRDREDRRGGGLCLLVKKNIRVKTREDVKWVKNKTEIIAITLTLEDNELDIVLVYRNPGYSLNKREWDKLFKNRRIGIDTIIMGDFNANNKGWNCPKNDREGILLEEAVEEQDLFIINDRTTSRTGSGRCRPSNLDLLITNFGIYQEARVKEEGETLGSDHQVVEIHIKGKIQRWEQIRYTTRKYDWKKKIREEGIMEDKMESVDTIEEKYAVFIESIHNGMERMGVRKRGENEGKSISYLNRIRANHYNLAESLFRKGMVGTPECECGTGIEDINHIFWKCDKYIGERERLRLDLEREGIREGGDIADSIRGDGRSIARVIVRYLNRIKRDI